MTAELDPPVPDVRTRPAASAAPSGATSRPPERRTFNETFADKDPIEFLGARLDTFEQKMVVPLPGAAAQHAPALENAVYQEVERRAGAGLLGDVEHRIVEFTDAKVPLDRARRYTRLQYNTLRGTQITTMFRCYTYGTSNLYLALDSFALGKFTVRPVVLRAGITALTALLFLISLSHRLTALFMVLLLALEVWYFWGRVLRASRTHGFTGGLRAVFPARLADSSFDSDDTLMHMKSIVPNVMGSLKAVAEDFDLDMRGAEEMLAEMTKNVLGTITVHNHGTMSGVSVGGSHNTSKAGR